MCFTQLQDMTDQELAEMAQECCNELSKSWHYRRLDKDEALGRVYIRLQQIRRKLDQHPEPIRSAMVAARFEFLKEMGFSKEEKARKERERNYAAARGCMWEEVEQTDTTQAVDDRDELERLMTGLTPDMSDVVIGRHAMGLKGREISRIRQHGYTWATNLEHRATARMRFNLSCSDMFSEYLDRWPQMREAWKQREHSLTEQNTDNNYDNALARAMQRWKSR